MAGLHLTPYGGHDGLFSTSVFKEGGCQGSMAVERSVSFPTLALALTVLFLIQSMAPLVANAPDESVLEEDRELCQRAPMCPFQTALGMTLLAA